MTKYILLTQRIPENRASEIEQSMRIVFPQLVKDGVAEAIHNKIGDEIVNDEVYCRITCILRPDTLLDHAKWYFYGLCR